MAKALRSIKTAIYFRGMTTALRSSLLLATTILLAVGCGRKEPSDAEMLQRDRVKLERALDGIVLDHYKFLKTCFRVMPVLDTTIVEHRRVKDLMDRIMPGLFDEHADALPSKDHTQKALTLKDVTEFLSAYLDLRAFLRDHDEDDFPTIMEGQAMLKGDSVETILNGRVVSLWPPLEPEARHYLQSIEHTLMSVFMMMDRSRTFTTKMLLYECAKSDMEDLEGEELKAFLQMIRGFVFFDQGLLYLSEKEYSDNLDWLHAHPDEELPLTSTILFWAPMFTGERVAHPVIVPQKAAHHSHVLLNHLLRAVSRTSMKRQIDEERALEDFEAIVRTAHEAGVDNEMVWSVEAYLYLHQGKTDEALAALERLKSSGSLGKAERKTVEESIRYLEQREPGKAMNGLYDRHFLGKLLIQYMYSRMEKQDWTAILKKVGIIQDAWLADLITKVSGVLEQVDAAASGDALKEKGKELKEKSKSLLDDLWN